MSDWHETKDGISRQVIVDCKSFKVHSYQSLQKIYLMRNNNCGGYFNYNYILQEDDPNNFKTIRTELKTKEDLEREYKKRKLELMREK